MKIVVILGSTRPGRRSERLAKWATKSLQNYTDVKAELLDLRDYQMPFFDEQLSPKSNQDRKTEGAVKAWLDKLGQADGCVIVTPEYNHAIPAVLKNAIDYIAWEIQKKPFAVVSHGSSGGARATSNLKISISEARGMVISTNVAITKPVAEIFDEEGNINPEYQKDGWQERLNGSLEELIWYTKALADARNKR